MSEISRYIASFPAPARQLMRQLRQAIRAAAPDAVETISYRMPAFDVGGRHLVYFAGFARHVGFYPGARVAAEFAADFRKFKCGKGSVQFPLGQPLPVGLVKRVVRFRLKQNRALGPPRQRTGKARAARR